MLAGKWAYRKLTFRYLLHLALRSARTARTTSPRLIHLLPLSATTAIGESGKLNFEAICAWRRGTRRKILPLRKVAREGHDATVWNSQHQAMGQSRPIPSAPKIHSDLIALFNEIHLYVVFS